MTVMDHPLVDEPLETKWFRLGDVASIDRKSIAPEKIADGTTYVGLENIVSGGEFLRVGPVENGELASQKFVFNTDHILYGKLRPYLAKIAMPDFVGICSTDILPIRAGDLLDKRFLAYFLRQNWVVDQVNGLASGANLPRISPKSLESIEVPVFPMAYQRRIAAILDKADHLRTQRREALAHLDALTQSVFDDMFGLLTEQHMLVTIQDVAEVQGGLQVTKKRDSLPERASYLRVANVYRGWLKLDEIKTIGLTAAERKRTTLQNGDLLVVEGHGNPDEIGRCGLWSAEFEDCVHQNHLIRIRPNSHLNSTFAMHYLNSMKGRQFLLRSSNTTSGLNTISTSTVKACPIAVPPLELQQTFARRVAGVERLKEQHRTQLAELDTLFASLQDRAFRGEL